MSSTAPEPTVTQEKPTNEQFEPPYRRFVPAWLTALIGLRGRFDDAREDRRLQDKALRDKGITPVHTPDEKLTMWTKWRNDRAYLIRRTNARHNNRPFFLRLLAFAGKAAVVWGASALIANAVGQGIAWANHRISPTDRSNENGLPTALWANGKDAKAAWTHWLKDHKSTLEETFRGTLGVGNRTEIELENTPQPDEAYSRSVGPNAYIVKQDEINIDRYGGISFSGTILAQGSTETGSVGGPVEWSMDWDGSGDRVEVATPYQATFLLNNLGNPVKGANGEPIIDLADRLTLVHGHYEDWNPNQSSLTYDYFGSPIPVLDNDSVFGRIPRDVNPDDPTNPFINPDNQFNYRTRAIAESLDGKISTESKAPQAYYVIPAQVSKDGDTIYPSAYFQIKTDDNGPLQDANGNWNPTAFVYWPFLDNNRHNLMWLRSEDAGARAQSNDVWAREHANEPSINTFTADWLANNTTRAIARPTGMDIDPASYLKPTSASPTDIPRFDYAGPKGNSFNSGRSTTDGQGLSF